MAKFPSPGKVKTRLQPYLTESQSAETAKNFLLDMENKIQGESNQTIVAFTPKEKRDNLKNILQHKHILIEQKGNNLGERIYNAFESTFIKGFEPIIMIGTDSPNFPDESIKDAFNFLNTGADAVLGETEDGGFYLIGLHVLQKGIFRDVKWSSAKTSKHVKWNMKKLGLSLKLLPKWYDVDSPKDLKRLYKDLEQKPKEAPRTTKWLKKI